MSTFKEVTVNDISCDPFQMIGKDWTLITAKKGDRVNTMTASWGGMGVLWGQNVVYIFVRQSRFTKEFLDAGDHFSLSFYPDIEKKTLSYFGSTSGRDEDKIAKAGYHTLLDGDTPYFQEAETVLICKKLSRHFIDTEGMLDEELMPKWYTGANEGDFHYMYVGKIEKVLVKESK